MFEFEVHGPLSIRLRVGSWHFRTWRSFVMRAPKGYRSPERIYEVIEYDSTGAMCLLAAFFDEAVRGGYADQDMNQELTAIELSQYLHDRYRADVKAFGNEQYVSTGGPQSSYQHLVVDRGGVGAYNVLFHH